MRCYRCGVSYPDDVSCTSMDVPDKATQGLGYRLVASHCPECGQMHVVLEEGSAEWTPDGVRVIPHGTQRILYPQVPHTSREEVPEEFSKALNECKGVLGVSPWASVLLARSLLQYLLRTYFSAQGHNLSEEIDSFTRDRQVPAELRDALHIARRIANKVAHPERGLPDVKQADGQVLLEVLEVLVELYVSAPKRQQRLLEELQDVVRRSGEDWGGQTWGEVSPLGD